MKKKIIITAVMIMTMMIGCIMPNGNFTAQARLYFACDEVTLYVGQEYNLPVKQKLNKQFKKSKYTKNLVGKKLKWKSHNKKIATISKKGVIKAKSAGRVKINAWYKKMEVRAYVNVMESEGEAADNTETTNAENAVPGTN